MLVMAYNVWMTAGTPSGEQVPDAEPKSPEAPAGVTA